MLNSLVSLGVLAIIACTLVDGRLSTSEKYLSEQLPTAIKEMDAAKESLALRFRSVHTHFHIAASSHAFNEQAEVSARTFNRGTCDTTKFLSDYSAYIGACPGFTFDPLFNSTASAASIDAVCDSGCLNSTIQLYVNHSRCIPGLNLKDLVYFGNYAKLACQRAPLTNERCAIASRAMDQVECDNLNSAQCAAKPDCRMDSNNKCGLNPQPATLNKICNKCIFGILRLLAIRTPATAISNMLIKGFICRRRKGHYCLARAAPLIDDHTIFGFQANASHAQRQLTAACNDSITSPCFRGIAATHIAIILEGARQKFRSCMQLPISFAAKRTACWDPFQTSLIDLTKFRNTLRAYCSYNPLNNKYCYVTFAKAFKDTPCITAMINPPHTCSATCDPIVAGIAREIGCCGSVLNRLIKEDNGDFDAAQAPGTVTFTVSKVNRTIDTLTADQKWDQHVMKGLTLCTSLRVPSFRQNMTAQCQYPKANKVIKLVLALQLSYTAINNTAFRAKLLQSLQEDAASSLDLNDDQVKDPVFAEDSSRVVVTSRHHFGALSSSGTTATLEIETETDDEATAVESAASSSLSGNEYDSSASEGTAANECSDCVSADGQLVDTSASSVSTVAVTASPGAVSGSTMAPGGSTASPGDATGTDSPQGTPIPGAPGGTTDAPGLDDGTGATAAASIMAVFVALIAALM